MEPVPVLVFVASAIRARLTLIGTLVVFGVVLRILHVDWWGVGLGAACLVLCWALPLRGEVLCKVVVQPQTVTLEFASFGRRVRRTKARANIAGLYRSSVGPKGIKLMVLALTDTATNETIAEVQADVTGWREQDLVALAKALSPPTSPVLATQS